MLDNTKPLYDAKTARQLADESKIRILNETIERISSEIQKAVHNGEYKVVIDAPKVLSGAHTDEIYEHFELLGYEVFMKYFDNLNAIKVAINW